MNTRRSWLRWLPVLALVLSCEGQQSPTFVLTAPPTISAIVNGPIQFNEAGKSVSIEDDGTYKLTGLTESEAIPFMARLTKKAFEDQNKYSQELWSQQDAKYRELYELANRSVQAQKMCADSYSAFVKSAKASLAELDRDFKEYRAIWEKKAEKK